MGQDDRFKRPELPRTAPIRQFRDAPPESGALPSDAIGRGVGMGYRVISEYVRRGQEAARNLSMGAGLPSAPDPQQLAGRMVQYGSDLMAAWMEFVELSVKNINPAAPPPPAEPRPFSDLEVPPASAAPPAAHTEPGSGESERPVESAGPVGIRLEANRRAIVRLDLRGSIEGRKWVVHELRSSQAQQPRISGVVFERTAQGALLSVKVPDDQPAGIYNGMIVDEETSLPAGTVSVQVEP
jgi:hypothetical protein